MNTMQLMLLCSAAHILNDPTIVTDVVSVHQPYTILTKKGDLKDVAKRVQDFSNCGDDQSPARRTPEYHFIMMHLASEWLTLAAVFSRDFSIDLGGFTPDVAM